MFDLSPSNIVGKIPWQDWFDYANAFISENFKTSSAFHEENPENR
jgi:hypothetical protein